MARRTGRIDEDGLRGAVRLIDDLYDEIRVIGIDGALARLAGELAERHGLRGYDAVHLASAISIEDADLVTATWDDDLATAVTAAGYAVVPS
jgi:predicted nucleic acid-binding protein